jgi:acetyl-CoA carboxylase biotin carboxyl carrier protein
MTGHEVIESPTPGIFYRRPDPDEEPFVEVGDEINQGDVVCLVGVMKNFNEISTPFDGEVKEIHLEDETEVESGNPLITIQPR